MIKGLGELYWWDPVMVNHHRPTFGGYRQYGSGDIMLSIVGAGFHMLLLKSSISVYLCLKHMT